MQGSVDLSKNALILSLLASMTVALNQPSVTILMDLELDVEHIMPSKEVA